MNPDLYKLPLRNCGGDCRTVMGKDGEFCASFDTKEQAADFIADLNQHAPKQPTRPREMWALWHNGNGVFCRAAEHGKPILVFLSEEEARVKTHSMWRVVRFDTLPVEGEP